MIKLVNNDIITVMDVQVLVKRRTIAITFSRDFEALLFNQDTDHISLTHDLEAAALAGLELLEELEDVTEIKHVAEIKELIAATNEYSKITSDYFTHWSLNIAEDLLDEADLLMLAHGEDLKELGLEALSQGTILVLLALAAFKKRSGSLSFN